MFLPEKGCKQKFGSLTTPFTLIPEQEKDPVEVRLCDFASLPISYQLQKMAKSTLIQQSMKGFS